MKPGSLMQSQGNAERCRLKQVKGDVSRWRQGSRWSLDIEFPIGAAAALGNITPSSNSQLSTGVKLEDGKQSKCQ